MNKAFALFITLAIVAAISVAIYINLKNIDNYSKKVEKEIDFIQFNKNILDIEKIIKGALDKVEDKDSLDLLYSMPFDVNGSNVDKNIGSFSISFVPFCNKINLNLLYNAEKKKENKQVEKVIREILEAFSVEYPGFFIDILLDTLDQDSLERSADSEVLLKYPDFLNGHIYNYEQLKFMVDYYATITEDKNIYSVPFQDLFGFQCDGVGFYFMNPVLKKILFNIEPGAKDVDFASLQKDFNETITALNMQEYLPIVMIDITKNGHGEAKIVYDLRIKRYIKSYVSW